MSETYYAVEIETESNYTNSAVGMYQGFLRIITGLPGYTTSNLTTGDHNNVTVTINGTESIGTAFQSGQLYTASNGIFKTANTVPEIGSVFCSGDTTDFTAGDLATAKGSSPIAGDLWRVTNNRPGTESIEHIGINYWYQDQLTMNGLGKASRRVDLEMTGGYGTLSGFSFTVSNNMVAGSTNPIWHTLAANDVYLTNKVINVYIVLDDLFYKTWSGVVDNTTYNETDFKFNCKANYKKVHKTLPPNTFNSIDYPNTVDDVSDEAVPICFGDVEYAKTFNVSGDPQFQTLYFDSDKTGIGLLSNFYQIVGGIPWLEINSPGLYGTSNAFEADQFKDMYLFVLSGENADTSKGIRILTNGATDSGDDTLLQLSERLIGFDASVNGLGGSNDRSTNRDKLWYFAIADLSTTNIVSNDEISEFKTDDTERALAWYYNKDTNDYEDIKFALNGNNTSNANYYNNATINILSNKITKDGEIDIIYPIPMNVISAYPAIVGSVTFDSNFENLTDFDRTTYQNVSSSGNNSSIRYNITLNTDELKKDFSELYFGIDIDVVVQNGLQIATQISPRNIYGGYHGEITQPYYLPYTGVINANLLPNEYYRNNGNDNNERSSFIGGDLSGTPFKELMLLDSSVYDHFKNGLLTDSLLLALDFDTSNPFDINIKQFGFFGIKTLDVTSDNVFTRVSGELLSDGTTQTFGVYETFRRMLEDYDGIDTSDIEYGNLPTKRQYYKWNVSKQLVDRKISFEHIKDLAENSFVQVWQNRIGKLELSAWLEDETTPIAFTESNIISDSIKKYEKTSLDKVYNNFNLKYSYNPGADKYFNQYQVFGVDDSGERANNEFPELWDVCNAAYQEYGVQKEFKKDLHWFADRRRFEPTSWWGYDGFSSQYSFLAYCCKWITRQKINCIFEIPMTSDTVLYELCRPCTFNDSIYTNGSTLNGYIYLLEYDFAACKIRVGILIEPQDSVEDNINTITETTSAPDTITESGSQPDTITEQGL